MIKPHTSLVLPPTLPEQLTGLHQLSMNYWWCWNPEAIRLFSDLDPDAWQACQRNPVVLLAKISPDRLQQRAQDEEYVRRLHRVTAELHSYLDGPARSTSDGFVAYFCAEFGIHESFSSYSGGLGVLAGDHLKSASDLGLPLVGVGLFYHEGYFHQHLAGSGWQQEVYRQVDPATLPLTLMTEADGTPLHVWVEMPKGRCWAQIWRLQVGRVPLYLLDSNVSLNDATGYRSITDRLYGGDVVHRIEQEMLLGIGGMRALRALGIEPHALHINEGHAAFSLFERTSQLQVDAHLEFEEAWLITQATTVFTTHTPVPAGNEVFEHGTLRPLFEPYAASIGRTWEQCASLGAREHAIGEGFSMTVLGLRGSSQRNGVSQLHGAVARSMWSSVWPQAAEDEVPISSITNGVHPATWLAPEWIAPELITPDHERVWDIHQHRKARLLAEVHRRTNVRLQPEALTIGFARRFATYKRADLLLHDVQRLARIIGDHERPVQCILAGKAHPKDGAGKELIQKVYASIREHGLQGHVVFVEDYDMDLARLLVRGCDVWLNTPERPHEASGTSGMKAAMNGVLHCSILDGWWAEAYDPQLGFAIGAEHTSENFIDASARDAFDAASLYDVLEHRMIPLYYDEPDEWRAMMVRSMTTLGTVFSALRMVEEYQQLSYAPAIQRYADFRSHQAELARSGRRFQRLLEGAWERVSIVDVSVEYMESVQIRTTIHLGQLTPEDVHVQALIGAIGADGAIIRPECVELHPEATQDLQWLYQGASTPTQRGRIGVAVRILPRHPAWASSFDIQQYRVQAS
ncbi:MAG: alpha-glucan family phosphorylase [Candidatus Kapaibacteriota bacterium]